MSDFTEEGEASWVDYMADQCPSRQNEEENLERMATEGLPSDLIAAQIHQENADANATRGAAERRAAKGENPWDSPYIYFKDEEIPADRKTKIIGVYSKSSSDKLGEIRWWGAWRQYTFFPASASVWNIDCMNSIIAKIKELVDERRSDKREPPNDAELADNWITLG